MGREIRRVPKGWEHPVNDYCVHLGGQEKSHDRYIAPGGFGRGKCFKPLYDNDFDTVFQEWLAGYEQWKRGEHPEQKPGGFLDDGAPFWEYAGAPPNPEYYRPAWSEDQATCYQIYETVSEGTPTSPVFETIEEMKAWLIENGISEKAAEEFVKDQWVPSAAYSPKEGFVTGIEVAGMDRSKQ